MSVIASVIGGFMEGWKDEEHTHPEQHQAEDKKLRTNLKEYQVDDMVVDSFPASDPPSTY